MRSKELFAFIKERHSIYTKRQQGKSKPWTQDPILQQYRFCNMYRELDTVTQWIAKHWREPNTRDPYIWFAMTVARLINLPASLEAIGYPVPWHRGQFLKALVARQEMKLNVFNGAYMIRSDKMPKIEYLAYRVLDHMWVNRDDINLLVQAADNTLLGLYIQLENCNGLGSFLAGQVIADVKYTARWRKAKDWKEFAVPGPGSKRGLNRVCGRPVDERWLSDNQWWRNLHELYQEVAPMLKQAKMPEMHYQDLQNCLCEWDKYERVRLNEGRPKARYNGI